ncbi:hypothetical protein Zm00014a_034685 [Zea mays]|uniref:Uncharacterized protein n=1 Tax=Zea mays TaxID=4577 RepID=A0A3L6G902_MAIZE|nr:hypothetical protein Zm00014a_034685 [Zea mays]
MAKFFNYTIIQGLLMLSMVLLASCAIHAHIISGETEEVSITGSPTVMVMMGANRKIIEDNKNLLCYLRALEYCCARTRQCYDDIKKCLEHCRG